MSNPFEQIAKDAVKEIDKTGEKDLTEAREIVDFLKTIDIERKSENIKNYVKKEINKKEDWIEQIEFAIKIAEFAKTLFDKKSETKEEK